jgi:L-iditol 2-dehydrogenase
MRHATFLGNGKIRIDRSDGPEPQRGEVVLRVSACALCGSDFRPWKQGWPVTPGHEIVGVVDHPGHRLHDRRCLVNIPAFCGACEPCRRGDTQLCETLPQLIGWQRPGGYAEALAVPEQCLVPVPDDIATELAPLLLDTIGTAGHGVRLAQPIAPAGAALVIGAGPIGLGAIMVLRRFGYAPIHVAELQAYRRDFAGSLGAVAIDLAARPQSYPLVIEATGKDPARQAALDAVAPRGAVVQLGESDAWSITETKPIRRKDFYLIRSFYFPLTEFDANLALLRADLPDYRRFVDARCDLDGLEALFGEFAAGQRIKPQLALSNHINR